MQNQCLGKDMFGDLKTQKAAQKALPILVEYAQEEDTILIRELAEKVVPHLIPKFNWTISGALGQIHTTLYKLQRQDDWECGEIPGITAIVLADARTPTNWAIKELQPGSWKDYETNHILPVFEYPHWDKVMDFVAEFNVNLDEVDFNNSIINKVQSSLFGSASEEEEQEVPEGEHRYFVYAWRWCGDEGFAKIGRTRNGLKGVENRMVTTYHPTDDPVLLGVRKCADAEESHKTEQYILTGLGRTRPDREWVEIDEKFNEMIDKSFMESQAD